MQINITVTRIKACTRFFKKISKGHNTETKKGERSFLCGTHCFDLIYISIKYHEDILKIAYGWTDSATP